MANTDSIRFTLPVGRIVSGSPTFKQTTDPQGRPKAKPNWFMAVAVQKTALWESPNAPQPGVADSNIDGAIGMLFNHALNGYASNPQVTAMIQQGLNGGFRWKIEDGDAPANAGKEGYAGCWIFKFSTTLGVPPCFGPDNTPMAPEDIKCGYWVAVNLSSSINGNQDNTAGIYLNPNGVQLVAAGPEIVSGPSAEQMFGNVRRQAPAGALTSPILGPGGSGMPQQPQPGAPGNPMQAAPGGFGGMPPQQTPAPAPQGFGQQAPAGFTPAPTQAAPAPAGNGMGAFGQPASPVTAAPSNQAVQPGHAFPGATPHQGFGQQ